jgi:HK97 gp10 family phage protein
MKVEYKITGLVELQRTLEQMPRDVARKAVRGGLTAAAEMVRDRIVATAPRKSGFLASHFNVKFRMRGDELAGTAYVGPAGKVYYPNVGRAERGISTGRRPHKGGLLPVASVARFLELGTSKMAAKPFIRPAFESSRDGIIALVVSSITDAIARWRR